MGKEIIWSARAIESFNRVIEYLETNWTEKQINSFVEKTEHTLRIIGSGKVKFKSSKKKNIFEVLVTKHNLLLYRDKKNKVELILFYDTRQHPKKKIV